MAVPKVLMMAVPTESLWVDRRVQLLVVPMAAMTVGLTGALLVDPLDRT